GWGGPTTGNNLAGLLLRDMSLFSMEKSANLVLQQRWQNVEGWIADSWRVHRRATLDLGLRFSHLPNPTAVGATMTSFDPHPLGPCPGNRPVQGPARGPRNASLRGRGSPWWHTGAGPHARERAGPARGPAGGNRLGRPRQRQDGDSGRRGPVLPSRRARREP